MSANSISSRFWRSLGRKRISFLPGSIKRDYIQNFKINTEGNTTKPKFRWYSDLPHSLIHITHFFLSRCGLGKGMKYTPFCSLSGYPQSVLHVPQAHRSTMFLFFFLQKQYKSTIQINHDLHLKASLRSEVKCCAPCSSSRWPYVLCRG